MLTEDEIKDRAFEISHNLVITYGRGELLKEVVKCLNNELNKQD